MIHHLTTALTFVTWVAFNFVYSYIWPYLGYDTAHESLGMWWPIAHIQLRFWAIAIMTSVIGVLFVEYWVGAMGWLNRLRHWGKLGGRLEAGRGVDQSKVKRAVEIEKPSANASAAGGEGESARSLKALRYQMAREDAAHAASHAVGEHNWAKEVQWWQVWERRHKIWADLGEDD
ncbi:hypothetical protein HDU67_000798 [Dinochytrium kinnereticum]|nr:hypothetical protein HDU67_000798 [Dinochytrium kinnereticum]